ARRVWERDRLLAQFDRDRDESPVGLDVHTGALEILAARGLSDSYTSEQYIDACKKAGAMNRGGVIRREGVGRCSASRPVTVVQLPGIDAVPGSVAVSES